MPEILRTPEVAAGATEVLLAEWTIKPGTTFAVGDVIAVVETEKASVEVEADRAATLLRILAEPGAAVEVGAPLALLGAESDLGSDLDAILAGLGVASSAGSAGAAGSVGEDTPAAAGPVRRDIPEGFDPPALAVGNNGEAQAGRVFISPIARKLLADAGLTTAGILGSGPEGRIRRRDVQEPIARAAAGADAPEMEAAHDPSAAPVSTSAAATAATAPVVTVPVSSTSTSAVAAGTGGVTEIPHTRLRRAIARRLTESKQQVPHFYVTRAVKLDALLALRATLNQAAPTKISVNDFLIRAIAVAHTDVPEANVIWTEDVLRQFSSVDISVAIASSRGLVTPVLRGVERASLSTISADVKRFVRAADDGQLQQRELEGGSITISNLGMFGVDEFSAIINPPQSAILAVGAAAPAPVVVDGEVTVATVLNLVLSVDHRAIDGALAARWMGALVQALENPYRLLV